MSDLAPEGLTIYEDVWAVFDFHDGVLVSPPVTRRGAEYLVRVANAANHPNIEQWSPLRFFALPMDIVDTVQQAFWAGHVRGWDAKEEQIERMHA